MNEVELTGTESRVGSHSIAKCLERDHKAIRDLIENYSEDLKDFSVLKTRKYSNTGGRPSIEYMLDEDQFGFLCTLLRNSPIVVKLKKSMLMQFKQCRKQLENIQGMKSSATYQSARLNGVILRLEETDQIKLFIEYAKCQGGSVKGCDRYYSNLTTMVNVSLFVVQEKFANLREMMTAQQ